MAYTYINDSIINTHINNYTSCNLSIGLKISGIGVNDTSNYSNIYDNNGIGLQLWSNTSNYRELAIIDTANAMDSNYATLRLGITQSGTTIKSITSRNTYKSLVINDFLSITSNRVGIGTTNPLNTLDIRGNITLDGFIFKPDGTTFTTSQWTYSTINSNNIYYNLGNIGIGTTNPIASLDIRNGNVILDNNSKIGIGTYNPQYTIDINNGNVNIGGNLLISLNNTINNYNIYTSSNSITFSSNTTADLLLVGAGGNGGIGAYSGGGGAGEVIYYPNYSFTAGTYIITVGLSSNISSNRISKITYNSNDIIKALGGGDGGTYQLINTDTTLTFTNNAIVKYNSGSGVNLNNKGICNITFVSGSINITGLPPDNSYPNIRDNNDNIINPTLWYKFDNDGLTINNGSDTNASYTNYGNVNNANVYVKGNNAVSFSTGGLSGSYTTSMSSVSWSISAWIYPKISNSANVNAIICFGTAATAYQSIVVGFGSGSYGGCYSHTDRNSEAYSANYVSDINTWVHVVFMYDSTTRTRYIYRNGVKLTLSGTVIANAQPNPSIISTIGQHASGALFNGYIDDLRLYRGLILTDNQITELYKGRLEININPISGGSGGGGSGGTLLQQQGALQGVKSTNNFSLINDGKSGILIKGGDGGSSIGGGYIEILTGSNLNVGIGGSGASAIINPITKINYGNGGDGGGGIGANGVIIIKYNSKKIGLGIGTTSPLAALDVRGNIMVSGFIIRPDGSLYRDQYTNTWLVSSNNSNIYYNLGYVGIGTDSPRSALDVNGNIYLTGTILKSGVPFAGTQWSNSTYNNIYYNIGNVGIGTTNPQSLLHLASSYNNTDIAIRFTDNITGHTSSNGLIVKKDTYQNGVLWNYQNTSLILGTNNIERLRISSNGNIGIGTINPQSLLHLAAPTSNTAINIQFTDATTGYTSSDGFIIQKDNNQNGVFWNYEDADLIFGNNNSEKLRIKNYGNVGIGTTNPLSLLHLYKSGISQNVLLLFNDQSIGGGSNNGIAIGKASDNTGVFWNYQNTSLIFGTNNIERLRISSNGNIGIGTTNPQSLLDVNGNINCDGCIAIAGSNAFLYTSNIDNENIVNTYITFKPSNSINDWCYLRQIGTVDAYKLSFDFYDNINDSRFAIRYITPTTGTDTVKEVFAIDGCNVYANTLQLNGENTSNTIFQQTGNLGVTVNNAANYINFNNNTNEIVRIANNLIYFNKKLVFLSTSCNQPVLSQYGDSNGDRIVFRPGWEDSSTHIYPCSIGIGVSSLWYSIPYFMSHSFCIHGIEYANINQSSLTIKNNLEISYNNNPKITFSSFSNTDIAVASTNGTYSTSAVGGDMVIRSQAGKNLILQNDIGAGHLIINNGKVGIGTNTPQSALDVRGDIMLSGKILKPDGSIYDLTNANLVNNASSNLVLKTNINTYILPSYKDDSNIYYLINNNNTIDFTTDTYCDLLVVGAGGNGGSGFYSGGGGAGEIIYYPNYFFAKGTYNFIIGYSSNSDITQITSNNNILIKANTGGKGGGSISQLINIDTTITLNKSTAFRYNYGSNIAINAGTYNITFATGSIYISTFTSDLSYPILKDNYGNDINPILWYKFEKSTNFLNDNFNSSNNLTNNGTTFDTTTLIKGSGSMSFSKTASQYATIPTNLDLNSINTKNGISFSLWYRMATTSGSYARVFDFGTRTSTGNGSRFITLYRYSNTNYLSVQIATSTVDGNATNLFWEFILKYALVDNTWYYITFTITPLGYAIGYVNAFGTMYGSVPSFIPQFTITKYYYLGKSNFTSDPFSFDGNIDDFRIYDFALTQNQINELYRGRVEIYENPTSGGSGGGGLGGTITQQGAPYGTINNINSILTNGNAGTITSGGNGGSADNGGYIEQLTGLKLNFGKGGYGVGNISNTYMSEKKIYGNGGDGAGGIGGNGVIIVKPIITKTISVSDTKLTSLNVSNINNSIIQNTVYPYLSSSLYPLNYINDTYGYYIITSNTSITFKKDTIVDLLLVGCGGNGGFGPLAGGGGAGEVIYYPNYLFNYGTYNIQVGYNYPNLGLRDTKIYNDYNNYIIAKGGGDGIGFFTLPTYSVVSGSVPLNVVDFNGTYCIFENSGTIKFTSNALISFALIGGGGSGGANNQGLSPGAGGGAGQYISMSNIYISANTSIDITIGSGGVNIPNSIIGSNGNNSSVKINNIIYTALGGGGATLGGASGGGNGGLASIFSITGYNGGSNGNGAAGGGAGGNGSNQSGNSGTVGGIGSNINIILLSVIQVCGGGNGGTINTVVPPSAVYGGGQGGGSTGLNGGNATSYGSGGGGASYISGNSVYNLGGAGKQGAFIIKYQTDMYNLEQYKLVNYNIGGGGGGSYYNLSNSILKSTPWNVNYSLLNNGTYATSTIGGSGGSALSTGGYTEVITGSNILVGCGGNGSSSNYSLSIITSNYGSGGNGGNSLLGKEGIVIIKFPIENITSYNGYYLSDNNYYVKANETGFIRSIYTNNIYYNRGFVGIGITVPMASLHVNSNIILSGNISNTNQSGFTIQSPTAVKFSINNNTLQTVEINNGFTNFKNQNVLITGNLTVSGNIEVNSGCNINITGGGYYKLNNTTIANATTTFSDYRIKTNIIDINDDNALQQILAIKPKTFNYIDINERGSNIVYGFIAQDVKEVIPQAVKIETQYVPNIYKSYNYINNEIIIDEKLNDRLILNDKILLKDDDNYYKVAIITEITSNIIKVDIDIKGNNCFIYGKEIQDFHTLDKSYIYTLNVCATQNLYKLIEQQQSNIDSIKTKINDRQSNIQQIYQLLQ